MSKNLEGNVPTKLFPRDDKKSLAKSLFFVWVKNMPLQTLNYLRGPRLPSQKIIKILIFFLEIKVILKFKEK